MVDDLGFGGWREFEDGLYDIGMDDKGSIGREAFKEYVEQE